MSIHHVECAALTTLPASTKLALMAFADSADKETRVALPGLGNVMAWSGLRKSRALEVTSWLVDQGYLCRVGASKPGQRAEYLVFPAGCCLEHSRLDNYDGPDPRNTSAMPDPNTANTSDTSDVNKVVDNLNGSGTSDVNNSYGSDTADPFTPNGSDTADPYFRNGSDSGPVQSGPLPTFLKKPPPPPDGGTGTGARSDGSDGGGGDQHEVQRFFADLGRDWILSGSQRERLAPLVAAALDRGWSPNALAAHLDTNTADVRNPYAVLRSRLTEIPQPPSRGSEMATAVPEWCGECDGPGYRFRELSDGRWARCSNCHPTQANSGPRVLAGSHDPEFSDSSRPAR